MDAIHIHTTLNSETLKLPELKPLLGKSVEIIVREKAPTTAKTLSAKDKRALRALLTAKQYEALVDVAERGGPDRDAIARLRAASMT